MTSKYTREELLSIGVPQTYSGQFTKEISFPLGGIGTGSIGLTGQGNLRDWEIFNRPNHGSWFPQTFPMLRVQEDGKDPVCRILEGPIETPLLPLDGGKYHNNAEGLPHMAGCEFQGEFPIAHLSFREDQLPIKVELEAYNPFIPGDPDASGYPAAILKYTVTNLSEEEVEVAIAWCIRNLVGTSYGEDVDRNLLPVDDGYGRNVNTPIDDGDLHGVIFTSEKYPLDHSRFGSMVLATVTAPDAKVIRMVHWPRKPWFEPLYEIWDIFERTGTLPQYDLKPTVERQTDAGAVGSGVKISPGTSEIFTFYITWYFPNFEKYWAPPAERMAAGKPITWLNYYATQFKDAVDVARQLHSKESLLHENTQRFHDALFASTLPPYVLDAISANLGIIKTTTVLRLPDGTLYGFEGTNATTGCCEGSCTHVYNYEQVLPFLFPSLERGMREADYQYNFLGEEGALNFRIVLPLGKPGMASMLPCADGQLGDVIKIYRDWKISGNNDWLRKMWPSAKRALEFAWVEWDEDKDGVMEGSQHNTYDVNFMGPNSMLTSIYLGALRAGEEMARYLGDVKSAVEYHRIYEHGRTWVDEHLFNGEYYFQQYDDEKQNLKFQYGVGCLSDQVVGQCYAALAGLGEILDPAHVLQALKSVFNNNWKPSLREHPNAMRLYAVNDEAGLLICTWPKGNRPKSPLPYCDEVMNGFEYLVAIHCIHLGMLDEGLSIVKGIRDRYNGFKRNPWDEFECGHHYARSMASFGLLLALSGFQYDKGAGFLGFSPKIPLDDFQCFWALDGVWGTYSYSQTTARVTLKVLYGSISLKKIQVVELAKCKVVKIISNKKSSYGSADESGLIILPQEIQVRKNETLTLERKNDANS